MSKVEKVARAIQAIKIDGRRIRFSDEYAALLARAAIEAIDADDDAFVHAVGELMHDARFSVSGETYPVVRNFIRALKAVALNEEE